MRVLRELRYGCESLNNTLMAAVVNTLNEDTSMETLSYGSVVTPILVNMNPEEFKQKLKSFIATGKYDAALNVVDEHLTRVFNNISRSVKVDSILNDYTDLIALTKQKRSVDDDFKRFIKTIEFGVSYFDNTDIADVEPVRGKDMGIYWFVEPVTIVVSKDSELDKDLRYVQKQNGMIEAHETQNIASILSKHAKDIIGSTLHLVTLDKNYGIRNIGHVKNDTVVCI